MEPGVNNLPFELECQLLLSKGLNEANQVRTYGCVVAWSISGPHGELLHEKEDTPQKKDQHSISENQGLQPGNAANRRAIETDCDSCVCGGGKGRAGGVQEH